MKNVYTSSNLKISNFKNKEFVCARYSASEKCLIRRFCCRIMIFIDPTPDNIII